MDEDSQTRAVENGGGVKGFLASFLLGLVRDAVKLVVAFAIGTGAGAIACWYYDVPMIFSLAGGILVLVLVLMFSTDGLFS